LVNITGRILLGVLPKPLHNLVLTSICRRVVFPSQIHPLIMPSELVDDNFHKKRWVGTFLSSLSLM